MLRKLLAFAGLIVICAPTFGAVQAKLTDFHAVDESIVLKNDDFNEAGGAAAVQLGFVSGEKAGVWLKVPENIALFKVDAFRVLFTAGDAKTDNQIFFQMGISDTYSTGIPAQIENAAQLTAGPYWNDIPAQGAETQLGCAKGGQLIGAALEFTHSGAPSVARDTNGISNAKANVLMAIPGGWNYSASYGLTGDWILRVVGHPATPEECK